MTRALVILLCLCTLAAAMVPRTRFSREVPACEYQTPCSWTIYEKGALNNITIHNNLCNCEEGYECIRTEVNEATATGVNKCRSPLETADT